VPDLPAPGLGDGDGGEVPGTIERQHRRPDTLTQLGEITAIRHPAPQPGLHILATIAHHKLVARRRAGSGNTDGDQLDGGDAIEVVAVVGPASDNGLARLEATVEPLPRGVVGGVDDVQGASSRKQAASLANHRPVTNPTLSQEILTFLV